MRKGELNSLLMMPIPACLTNNLRYELDPQWIGTVKTVYVRDPNSIAVKYETNNLRLTHFWYQKVDSVRDDQQFELRPWVLVVSDLELDI